MSSYTPISRAIIDIRVVTQEIVTPEGDVIERYQQQILRDDGEGWKPIEVIREKHVQVTGATITMTGASAWIEEAK